MIQLRERRVSNRKNIDDYREFGIGMHRDILRLGKKLKGRTVIHVNATAQGGGVAELLTSQVALERSLGINSKWFVIDAPPEFFKVTKTIHNLCQGMPGKLTLLDREVYMQTNDALSESLTKISARLKPDVIMVHDPQPMAMAIGIDHRDNLVLRLHIDYSEPNKWITEYLKHFLGLYRTIIVSSKYYFHSLPQKSKRHARVIMPAIDPLSDKNLPQDKKLTQRIVKSLGIDPYRPLMSQVSRFDPWKDPAGVIEAYRIAKKKIPDLQLALAGIINAADDPEAWTVLRQVQKQAQGDPDIHLFWDESAIRFPIDQFINAIYSFSSVVVQKSIKEGFGLTVTEAMWKGKPVVGGNAHGIRLQIKAGANGLIASDKVKVAQAVASLVENPKLAAKLGKAAKTSVQKSFLLPRYLLDHLKIYETITRKNRSH